MRRVRMRKGVSLLETMIAVGIFALLIGIIVADVAIMITSTAEEAKANTRETEAATFLYHILTDMKSANAVTADEGMLIVYSSKDAHTYAFDDRTGTINRDDERLVRGYQICDCLPVDDTSFILRFAMSGDDLIESTIQCGAVEQIYVDYDESEVPEDD